MGEDCSVASGVLRGFRAIIVVTDACCRDGGVGFSADGFDDEVRGCAVDATVEGFTHHIFVSNDQFSFFRPCFTLVVWRGLLGDVGGYAEGEELVVALDVGDDSVESFCVVGEDSRCG